MVMTYRKTCFVVAALAFSFVLAAKLDGSRPSEPPLAGAGGHRRAARARGSIDPRAQLTETVGLLSGLYLYQTY